MEAKTRVSKWYALINMSSGGAFITGDTKSDLLAAIDKAICDFPGTFEVMAIIKGKRFNLAKQTKFTILEPAKEKPVVEPAPEVKAEEPAPAQ